MEFRAKRGDFLATLYWSQGIVERRNTMPILANVLIEAHSGTVHLTATDLEVGIRGKLEGEVASEGIVTVSAKKLYEIVREAPDESLQVRRLENEWVEIKSGKSVFKIVGLDAREFPQFPKFEGEKLSSLPAKVLREMIERTIFSVSSDETRYNLNGVFVEEIKDGRVRMVATDGHRLALIERGIGSFGLGKGVILPRKGLAELRRLLEGAEDGLISIGFKESMGLVVKDNVELFMRLIEGDFPDYSKVIPKDNPQLVRFEQNEFLHALRRVSILSSERYKGIKLELKTGKASISASNPELGEAVEEIEMDYQGKALTVGFNARYLIDVLTVLGDGGDVEVALKDDVSPGILRKGNDDGYLYVIMPMRL
ncbi:MAG TPA: DNA polymerase III subunit beta [Candidatus Binatia bacterium]|jgi:DNA polymerase-3 subunit beta